VIICTPDKDLAQCVRGTRVVQMDRRQRIIRDEAAIVAKFGVPPASIPDYLALVGDNADGYPGLPGWGAKSTAAVLAKFGHLESIPSDWRTWGVNAASPGCAGENAGARARVPSCFATWRRSAPTRGYLKTSKTCAGMGRRRRSLRSPLGFDAAAAQSNPARAGGGRRAIKLPTS
jgi:hypothetical protein